MMITEHRSISVFGTTVGSVVVIDYRSSRRDRKLRCEIETNAHLGC